MSRSATEAAALLAVLLAACVDSSVALRAHVWDRATGAPVAGAEIAVRCAEHGLVAGDLTASDGRFEGTHGLTRVDRSCRVEVQAAGYRAITRRAAAVCTDWRSWFDGGGCRRLAIAAGLERARDGGTPWLRWPLQISAEVRDDTTGAPLAGAAVRVICASLAGVTARDGTLDQRMRHAAVLARGCRVVIEADGYRSWATDVEDVCVDRRRWRDGGTCLAIHVEAALVPATRIDL